MGSHDGMDRTDEQGGECTVATNLVMALKKRRLKSEEQHLRMPHIREYRINCSCDGLRRDANEKFYVGRSLKPV